MHQKTTPLDTLARAALFAALIFLGTYVLKIPIPSGYIHFGDGFLYAAAVLLPPAYAAGAGAIGGLLSDMLAGYAAYAPWTAVIKAAMALPMAFLCRGSGFIRRFRGGTEKPGPREWIPVAASLLISGVLNVGGYFLADSMLYGVSAAVVSLPLNAVQSAAGIAVFFVTLPVFGKIFRD